MSSYDPCMTRSEITDFLGRILVRDKLSYLGACWAKEVSLGPRSQRPPRVDFLEYKPANRETLQGIEHGTFIGWEVKSCRADVVSGHGLNLVGDVNYVVMAPWTWREVSGDADAMAHLCGFGVYVPRFELGELMCGEEYPTSFLGWKPSDFRLKRMRTCPSVTSPRTEQTSALLVRMLAAGHKGL